MRTTIQGSVLLVSLLGVGVGLVACATVPSPGSTAVLPSRPAYATSVEDGLPPTAFLIGQSSRPEPPDEPAPDTFSFERRAALDEPTLRPHELAPWARVSDCGLEIDPVHTVNLWDEPLPAPSPTQLALGSVEGC